MLGMPLSIGDCRYSVLAGANQRARALFGWPAASQKERLRQCLLCKVAI